MGNSAPTGTHSISLENSKPPLLTKSLFKSLVVLLSQKIGFFDVKSFRILTGIKSHNFVKFTFSEKRTKIATHLNSSTATKLRLLYSATLAMLSKCYFDAGSA